MPLPDFNQSADFGQLLAQCERLRSELEEARLNTFCKDHKPQSMEMVYAHVDRETTLEQIIAEFEQATGSKDEGWPSRR
jgi:hypothetical protein